MRAQVEQQINTVLTQAARNAGVANGATAAITRVSRDLAGQYDAVIAAAVTSLRRSAERLGADRTDVDQALVDAGLLERQPARGADGQGQVTVTRQEFDDLVAFARRNGYQG
jgi:hypothetical protein